MMKTCKILWGGCGFTASSDKWEKKEDPFYKNLDAGPIEHKVYNYHCPNCGKIHNKKTPEMNNESHWQNVFKTVSP